MIRILILGLNYAPEQIGIGPYTTGMAEALAEAGHEVRVVAAQPYYPAWTVPAAYRGLARDTMHNGVIVTRVPLYVPNNPSGVRRVLHHLSFAVSALRTTLAIVRRWRPDIVWTVAPSLMAAPVARWTARRARVPAWLHTQDFEIEAAFATGLLDAGKPVGKLALAFQKWAMRGFSVYSSISPQMCARLSDMGVMPERIVEFRNWADVGRIPVLSRPSPYRQEWNITTPYVALYSGNISNKQGIGIIVEAARRLVARKDLTFVVCGDGPQLAMLKEEASGLSNIRFHPLQPMERLGDLVGLATVHLLPQLENAADLVLPSKLTNMLASGRPVVATAAQGTGLASEVEGCGLIVPPGNAHAFSGAIAALLDDEAARDRFGAAARERAEARWSKTAILEKFEYRLQTLAQTGRLPSS